MFKQFTQKINQRLNTFTNTLYTTDATDLKDVYLSAFPEGTNPIFKIRAEHDCSCCNNFLRNLGAVVTFKNGTIQTLWDDYENLPHPYNEVAKALSEHLKAANITGVYKTKERKYGAESTYDSGNDINWNHFWGETPSQAYSATPERDAGSLNTTAQMVERAKTEIDPEAVQIALELIEGGSLYRGTEHLQAVKHLQSLLASDKSHWELINHPGARVRNTVIGSLITDLSEGKELEYAVKSFEQKVAPANYQRPKALVTPKMVEQALATLDNLNLRHTVTRRMATLEDVNINHVLWASGAATNHMKDDLLESILSSKSVKRSKVAKEKGSLTMDSLLDKLKSASKLEILFENKFQCNQMVLTTGESGLFKWDNGFAWSYQGDVADSMITANVKAKGGSVEGKLRVSLAWHNSDDLDLHCWTPDKQHIYHGVKAGILDLDANGGAVTDDIAPVENMVWSHLKDGEYLFDVNQFSTRTTSNKGYSLELAYGGNVIQFDSVTSPRDKNPDKEVLVVEVEGGEVVSYECKLPANTASKEVGGVRTQEFVPVTTLMTSPNHWNGEVGNKHWFFFMENAVPDEPARGIYNEYLKGELTEHRKVFEVLGEQTRCPITPNALVGLGFSTTKAEVITVKIDGIVYKVEV